MQPPAKSGMGHTIDDDEDADNALRKELEEEGVAEIPKGKANATSSKQPAPIAKSVFEQLEAGFSERSKASAAAEKAAAGDG